MDATLPFALNNPRFIAKWQEYVDYRKERRLPRLLPKSTQKQWDYLSDFGLEIACQAIDMTIRQNWQGLFPERVRADQQRLGVGAGSASLGALQMELKKVEEELDSISYPGGCAFPVQLTGEKKTRAEALRAKRLAIKANIDRISTRT